MPPAGNARIWMRVTVRCPARAADAAASALLSLSPNGIITDGDDPVRLTGYAGPYPTADAVADVDRCAREALAAVPRDLFPRPFRVEVEPEPEEDWIEAFRAQYTPVRVRRIVLKPTWEPWPSPKLAPRSDDIVIELDPGLAFGTGLHATTSLCLRELQQRVRRGQRVIDFGCGSGILAIAAAMLGAREVLAIDCDEHAAAVAAENIARNDLASVVSVEVTDTLYGVDPGWHMVVANIDPVVVAREAPAAAEVLLPGGFYLCTGVPLSREAEVLKALRAAPFEGVLPRLAGDWIGFVCMARRDRGGRR